MFGGFMTPDNTQCFIYYNEVYNVWGAARHACTKKSKEDHLRLPHLTSNTIAIWLREKLHDPRYTTGGDWGVWMGARGTGSDIKWQGDNEVLPESSPLWWPNKPGDHVGKEWCVMMTTDKPGYNRYPDKMWNIAGCSNEDRHNGNLKLLCELTTW